VQWVKRIICIIVVPYEQHNILHIADKKAFISVIHTLCLMLSLHRSNRTRATTHTTNLEELHECLEVSASATQNRLIITKDSNQRDPSDDSADQGCY
jgi:hypothetical protein